MVETLWIQAGRRSMAPTDASGGLPPDTPTFSDPKEERAFRRLVDSYGLTNVLYNYEIYEITNLIVLSNTRACVSRQGSIFDFPMVSCSHEPVKVFSLDRPSHPLGACHTRPVQGFGVNIWRETVCQRAHCSIGWNRRDQIFTDVPNEYQAFTGNIYLETDDMTLKYRDREGDLCSSRSLMHDLGEEKMSIRCYKNAETQSLNGM